MAKPRGGGPPKVGLCAQVTVMALKGLHDNTKRRIEMNKKQTKNTHKLNCI